MRRALVLTDESARHPFRRSLPAHVRQPIVHPLDPVIAPVRAIASHPYTRDFTMAFCACFIATSVFIA